VSIGALIAAGLLPALVLMICMLVAAYAVAVKRGYPAGKFPGWTEVFRSFAAALPGLLIVGIILTGILSGVFTATESAAVAAECAARQGKYAEMHDALAYDFDELKPDSAVVTMRWEKVAVPFKVAVNVNDIVTASLQKQMRGYPQYYWEGWDDAAGYLLANKINLDQALKFEDQSINIEERYDNLMSKSKILEAQGKQTEAASFKNKALDKANALQLYVYARQLQAEKKQDEALALFKSNAKKFPEHWTSHLGLARVYSAQGDFGTAVKEMKTALSGSPDANKSALENYIKRLEAKDDINR